MFVFGKLQKPLRRSCLVRFVWWQRIAKIAHICGVSVWTVFFYVEFELRFLPNKQAKFLSEQFYRCALLIFRAQKVGFMKYKYLIFDFDGTINDTSEGIYHTFKKVLDILGVDYTGVDFSRHIGPPLDFSYTELCGKQLCAKGIELHTKVFAEDNAVEMSRLYDGIVETLQRLKAAGYKLSIASSKYQPHAISSIKRFGLENLFDCVYGQNEKRGFKSEVLLQLIEDNGWEKDKCLMIGDTCYDVVGAHENGIDAMAVTYGFGKTEELQNSHPQLTAHSPREIADILLD